MKINFGKLMNQYADESGAEVTPTEVYDLFKREYLDQTSPYAFESFRSNEDDDGVHIRAKVKRDGQTLELSGSGNGPIAAFVGALQEAGAPDFEFVSYAEHSLSGGASARAAAYIEIEANGERLFGAGVDESIERASVKAVLSAVNRAI